MQYPPSCPIEPQSIQNIFNLALNKDYLSRCREASSGWKEGTPSKDTQEMGPQDRVYRLSGKVRASSGPINAGCMVNSRFTLDIEQAFGGETKKQPERSTRTCHQGLRAQKQILSSGLLVYSVSSPL